MKYGEGRRGLLKACLVGAIPFNSSNIKPALENSLQASYPWQILFDAKAPLGHNSSVRTVSTIFSILLLSCLLRSVNKILINRSGHCCFYHGICSGLSKLPRASSVSVSLSSPFLTRKTGVVFESLEEVVLGVRSCVCEEHSPLDRSR
jgi:hypothetical protein